MAERRREVVLRLPRPPPATSSSRYFPVFDEDCDNFGFSWVVVPSLELAQDEVEQDCGEGMQGKLDFDNSGTKERDKEEENKVDDRIDIDGAFFEERDGEGNGSTKRVKYEKRLQSDSAFNNPAGLELMAAAYSIPAYHSFQFKGFPSMNREEKEANIEEDWDYKTLQTRRYEYMSDQYTEKAILLSREGKYKESLEMVQKALAYNPENVSALVTSGANRANLSHYDLAIRDFEEALMIDPDCTNAGLYLQNTKMKAAEVKDISDITARSRKPDLSQPKNYTTPTAYENTVSSIHVRENIIGGGAIRSAANSYDNKKWTYVMDDEEEGDNSPKKRKDKKDRRRSSEKKSKKSKKRKRKKDKKHKKHKKSRKRAGSLSSSDSSSSDSNSDNSSQNRFSKYEHSHTRPTDVEDPHPILSRTKHKLWN